MNFKFLSACLEMIKNWFMLGFVKLSFEHYEVNIKKFKS